jgi:hypothetical protein
MTLSSKAFPKISALLLPLALAACQAPSGGGGAPPQRVVTPKGGGIEAVPPPSAGVTAPPPTLAELAADPQRFKGLSKQDVSALLGRPSFQRKDADAEIWQYYGPSSACVLDLFIYPEQAAMRVAHAELRSRGTGTSAANLCLKQILDGQRG